MSVSRPLWTITLPLAALAGCDLAFDLHRPTPGDSALADAAPDRCSREDFSTTYADIASRWDRYDGEVSTVPATVDVTGGALEFSLPSGEVLTNYAGIIRNSGVSFVGATAQFTLFATTQPTGVEVFMKLYDETDDRDAFQALLVEDTVHFIKYVDGDAMEMGTFPYDAITHHLWRVRHDPATHVLHLETSAEGETWIQRLTQPDASVALDRLRIELGAGTYAAQTATLHPRMDDFAFCPPP